MSIVYNKKGSGFTQIDYCTNREHKIYRSDMSDISRAYRLRAHQFKKLDSIYLKKFLSARSENRSPLFSSLLSWF